MGQFLIAAAKQVGSAAIQAGASALLNRVFSETVSAEPLSELGLQSSTEGTFIPIVYGRMRLTGQVVWTGPVQALAQRQESGGGKGRGPQVTEYQYQMSFAVALCEGPISGIGRIWANGEPLAHDYAVMRWHSGAEDQDIDPLIRAIEAEAPAYRGLAYVVFEDFPLDPFGLRIPNLSFEVITHEPVSDAPQLEELVKGVCLIPASGEFAYSTQAVAREIGPGEDRPENVHTARAATDLEAALDDLEGRLPNVKSVALVTAWFGTDLRCGQCEIKPGVDQREKATRPVQWSVAGQDRRHAYLISQTDAGRAYGGTPSDASVIEAIKALKARGYQVTLYPFILMDIPASNGLNDPYGRGAQPAYPWRGRITCDPAPGQPATADQTSQVTAQVQAFFGQATAAHFHVEPGEVQTAGLSDWGFARFILHHAALARAAGGVESLLIGSEMVGLTTLRDSRTGFPAITRLKALAAEARALLGAEVKLSYAADWSEYFGYAPDDGRGDRFFHLDPLWADPNIDYIGIDWYAPLSDWRDGQDHVDAGAGAIHELEYLKSNVLGGEGGDWFYATPEDRDAQIRTPIQDLSHGEDWIWRFKDLPGWWANPHHDRIEGVRQSDPTAWVPQSKPIRLVELGCPAVDKGSNQPNVFLDPKSAESQSPYFSNGARDDLIQRRFIEALLSFWAEQAGQNPVSELYGGPMLDLAHSHVWCWDGRPFPEFPARADIWSDGVNWQKGHWLNGRAGQSALGQVVQDIARRSDLKALDVSAIGGVLSGYVIERPKRARDIISELGGIFGFDLVDQANGPACIPLVAQSLNTHALPLDMLVDEGGWVHERQGVEPAPSDVQITVIADDGDYAPASVRALGLHPAYEGMVHVSAPLLADRNQARLWAQSALARAQIEGERLGFSLPPSAAALEPGDLVQIPELGQVCWRLDQCEGSSVREAGLGVAMERAEVFAGPEPQIDLEYVPPSRPIVNFLDLPVLPGETAPRHGLLAVGWARPWPNALTLYAGLDTQQAQPVAEIDAPGRLGVLQADLAAGPEGRWDHASSLNVRLLAGALSSVTETEVLSGSNLCAVETSQGWEVLSFVQARLLEDGSWRLSTLLRGLSGTPRTGAQAGARFVILDGSETVVPVRGDLRDFDMSIIAFPKGQSRSGRTALTQTVQYNALDLKPRAPVHLSLLPQEDGARLSWIRRTRIDGDQWGGLEVPLGEDREAYLVRGLDLSGQLRLSREVNSTWLDIGMGELGALVGGRVEVAQLSDQYGVGAIAHLNV